ncbi:Hypp8236 [Branchiostoma lanceolatum]|uniref:Hypp8236 protein n=1 Tax=Branchiostoma lanceolatum TaxID=7740 RepID=A0A8J9Z757_BRALA|nr:Hypp8236 [Branchiostoma lanceolatum]
MRIYSSHGTVFEDCVELFNEQTSTQGIIPVYISPPKELVEKDNGNSVFNVLYGPCTIIESGFDSDTFYRSEHTKLRLTDNPDDSGANLQYHTYSSLDSTKTNTDSLLESQGSSAKRIRNTSAKTIRNTSAERVRNAPAHSKTGQRPQNQQRSSGYLPHRTDDSDESDADSPSPLLDSEDVKVMIPSDDCCLGGSDHSRRMADGVRRVVPPPYRLTGKCTIDLQGERPYSGGVEESLDLVPHRGRPGDMSCFTASPDLVPTNGPPTASPTADNLIHIEEATQCNKQGTPLEDLENNKGTQAAKGPTVLQAVQLVGAAWRDTSAETILKRFQKAGFSKSPGMKVIPTISLGTWCLTYHLKNVSTGMTGTRGTPWPNSGPITLVSASTLVTPTSPTTEPQMDSDFSGLSTTDPPLGEYVDLFGTKGARMFGTVEVTITSPALQKKIFSGTRSDGRNFLHFDKVRTPDINRQAFIMEGPVTSEKAALATPDPLHTMAKEEMQDELTYRGRVTYKEAEKITIKALSNSLKHTLHGTKRVPTLTYNKPN